VHNISINWRICAPAIAVLASSVLGGCYLLQSAAGQLQLMSRRKPIGRVIANPATRPEVRTQLEAVAQIRDFATRRLGLPDNGSYRSYSDVGRPYVVWNVVAAPEFSVEPKEWCYPIVGCVAYRGYFVEHRARRFAQKLRRRGLDVTVGGVAAYSTIGHFDDPILNTMLGWDDVELAGIIFHELTHQLIYVAGDSSFDEALATAVEDEGVRRWLTRQGRLARLADYELERRRTLEVVALLGATRERLGALYGSGADAAVLEKAKRAEFDALRARYAALSAGWGGRGPFAEWFHRDLNNAYLGSIATYYRCVPGFERELAAAGGDLAAFYRRVRRLADLAQTQRDELLCREFSAADAPVPASADAPAPAAVHALHAAACVGAQPAQSCVVLEHAEVLARRGEHRMRLHAERGESVLPADAVDGE
jgi:predicted aminopeptidase